MVQDGVTTVSVPSGTRGVCAVRLGWGRLRRAARRPVANEVIVMSDRTQLSPEWEWARTASFSQGVRVGDTIYDSGMAALDAAGNVVAPGDMKAQAKKTFENIAAVLAEAGATLDDVVKITAYVTDVDKYAEYTQARAEAFTLNLPASATVTVPALVIPGLLVEVEAIARIGG